ncbi:collagen alpha-1(XII) chain [Striga asiatica]|uniref:Collagen alpha-1(XII) chain n=1 Tax=Striga asiatica TaxID=4170 RepID=A0A5A7Q1Q0_STRAF|nr:collagen alpha-1(XII) chain [Striga asiatica]
MDESPRDILLTPSSHNVTTSPTPLNSNSSEKKSNTVPPHTDKPNTPNPISSSLSPSQTNNPNPNPHSPSLSTPTVQLIECDNTLTLSTLNPSVTITQPQPQYTQPQSGSILSFTREHNNTQPSSSNMVNATDNIVRQSYQPSSGKRRGWKRKPAPATSQKDNLSPSNHKKEKQPHYYRSVLLVNSKADSTQIIIYALRYVERRGCGGRRIVADSVGWMVPRLFGGEGVGLSNLRCASILLPLSFGVGTGVDHCSDIRPVVMAEVGQWWVVDCGGFGWSET